MITKWKQVVKDTSIKINKKEKYIEIVIKHFMNGLKGLMKEKLLFKESGLFKLHVKKRRK